MRYKPLYCRLVFVGGYGYFYPFGGERVKQLGDAVVGCGVVGHMLVVMLHEVCAQRLNAVGGSRAFGEHAFKQACDARTYEFGV